MGKRFGISITTEAEEVTGPGPAAETGTSESGPFLFSQMSGCLAMIVPFLAVLLWLCELPALFWRPLSILLHLFVGLGAAVILLGMRLADMKADAVKTVLVLAGALTLVICYSQINRHLYLMIGGCSAADANYWTWLRFHLVNLMNGVLRNLPSSYEWAIATAIKRPGAGRRRATPPSGACWAAGWDRSC